MAATYYGVNSPEAVKLYGKDLAHEALKGTWAGKFMAKGQNSLIQLRDDTQKSAGDRVTITLRMLLNGDGVVGDGTLEGNEEALSTFTDNLFIDQLRHAVRSAGKMSEQRIPWSHREEAKDGLADWWSERIDRSFFNQICGFTPETRIGFTGMQAVLPATTVIRPNAKTADEQLANTDIFTLSQIDQAVFQAKVATPVLRPVKTNGNDNYVMFLHPAQVLSLRTNTQSGQWLDIQKAAATGDGSKNNPIWTGAIGMYNGVILHESVRVSQGVNSTTGARVPNVRRAVLCGAQSAAMGFGKGYSFENWDWNEELFDYKNQLGVEAGCIWGLKKLRFGTGTGAAAVDFSTIVVPTYSNALDA